MADISNRLVAVPQVTRKRHQIVTTPASVRRPVPVSAVQVVKQPVVKQMPVKRTERTKSAAASKPVVVAQASMPAPTISIQAPTLPAVHAAKNTLKSAIAKPRSHKRQEKPKGVRYVTPDVSQSEIDKARRIKGIGAGKVLVIVANGPSILEVDLPRLKWNNKIDIMSINRPDGRIWPTTYWTFFDKTQLRRNAALWEGYDNGLLFNSTSVKPRNNSIHFKNLGGFGFSTDLTAGLHIGRSSVYGAMQLALWMNYDKIFIFGIDMAEVDGKLHFYGVNQDVESETRKKRFNEEAQYYDDGATRLSESDRERFVFCSSYNKYQFVEKFKRLDHRVAVEAILQLVNDNGR